MVLLSNTSQSEHSKVWMPYIFAMYLAGLLIANVTGSKVMSIGPLVLSVGALAYPVTFVLQDVINEVYGKDVARSLVKATTLALLFLIFFAVATVPIDDSFNQMKTLAYELVLGSTPRIVFASMVAFLISGLIDVRVFFYVRSRCPDSLLMRKVCSTLVSQAIDSSIFVIIGFAGDMPALSLFAMAVSQYVVKQLIAVTGLPVTYFIVHRLR